MPSKSNVARATGAIVALSIATAVLASAPVHANAAQLDSPSAAAVAAAAAASAADVERPQGKPEPLKTEGAGKRTFSGAAAAQSAAAPVTRSEVIARAKTWVDAKVPYSMNNYRDGYRTDCSGLVSMAWNLGTSAWTGSLDTFADRISKDELRKGDMLLFHNPSNPERGSHVTIFEQWTDSSHTSYIGIEQTPPHAVRRVIPYAYFNNASSYVPYRYKNIIEDAKPTNAGVFRSDEAKFYVADRSGGLYGWAGFGVPGDKPLTGDWNGDGQDTFGVYRPEDQTFHLSNDNGTVAVSVKYGNPGDVPLVGDWDGNGTDTIGVYHPADQTFYLSNDNRVAAYAVKMGVEGDTPMTGDWNGDGKDTVGVYRGSDQTFYLTDSQTSAPVHHQVKFGNPGDVPIKGDWNGDGTDKVGVYQAANSDFVGAGKDSDTVIYSVRFGVPGDTPLTGQW